VFGDAGGKSCAMVTERRGTVGDGNEERGSVQGQRDRMGAEGVGVAKARGAH